jgi:UDP-N-acetylmuramoyl-L-alanyl-D-glutamate--2,6-diaminopimelate ligase
MGEVASRLSDHLIITSDNPRSEDPLGIIKEIEEGIEDKSGCPYSVIPDRREAISCAIDWARQGDMVIIAGKGHERYQILGDKIFPFDDREVARSYIKEKLSKRPWIWKP